jgi:hypothetical protein
MAVQSSGFKGSEVWDAPEAVILYKEIFENKHKHSEKSGEIESG